MLRRSHSSAEKEFRAFLVFLLSMTATAVLPDAAVAGDSAPSRSAPETLIVPPVEDESFKPELSSTVQMTMDEARRQGRGMRVLATLINTIAGLAIVGNVAMTAHPSEEPVPALWAVGGGVFVGGITLDIAGRTKARKAMVAVARANTRFEGSSLTAAERE
jgi:hypothetical protein